MVKQFIIRNTNLHIIYYETMHYVIYLIYFKKYLVLSKICVYLSVTSKRRKRHVHQKTTLTRPTISLFLETNRLDFVDTQADTNGFKNFSHRTKKLKFLCLPALAHLVLPQHTNPTLRKTKRANFANAHNDR